MSTALAQRPLMRPCWLMLALLATALAADAHPEPPLETLLERFRTYLTAYSQAYAATVSTEDYEQNDLVRRVRLESEFAMVRVPGGLEWVGFRDVLRVNGRDVTGRRGRLADLFANPSGLSPGTASRIAEESARFNIGPVLRTVNNPATVLELLAPRHHSRFHWSSAGDDRVGAMHAHVVRATEQRRPTIVRSSDGRDEPVEGRVWIDPVHGTVLRAALRIHVSDLYSQSLLLDVTFGYEKNLRMWVPIRMDEVYQMGGRDAQTGTAIYSAYRQFVVQSRILPPEPR